jgi:hypothetical protein
MPNRSYEKGTRAERELMAHAESVGCAVYRGSGSHGAYDVAVQDKGVRYLVNIKCNCWAPPHERTRLAALVSAYDVAVLARKRDRKGWDYRGVRDDGTMTAIETEAPWL